MKFVPRQCKVCPFRATSAPGWLGDYTAQSVFSSIWKGEPFFCHDSIDYTDPKWADKAVNSSRNGKLCVGGLAFANKILAPTRDVLPVILIGRERVKLIDVECMSPQEFGEHHPDWRAGERVPRPKKKSAPKAQASSDGGGECFHCKKPVKSGAFCFGCKVHVCDDCDRNFDMPWGPHTAEDHLEEPNEEASCF